MSPIRYSEKLRNAGLDARVAAIGPSPTLHIRDASGSPLVTMTLPKEWMTPAANGACQKAGQWTGTAGRQGEAASFCIADLEGDHITGDIPGHMTLDNPSIKRGQAVVVGRFILTAGNAAKSH